MLYTILGINIVNALYTILYTHNSVSNRDTKNVIRGRIFSYKILRM